MVLISIWWFHVAQLSFSVGRTDLLHDYKLVYLCVHSSMINE